MANKPLIVSLVFFSLFYVSSSLSAKTLLEAADFLSNSGYLSISLTLQLVSKSLIPHSPSLTSFSPDSAFARSGQPLFPSSYSILALFLSTSDPSNLSIHGSPIYDDGSLVILGIDKFLDPEFEVSGQIQGTGGNLGCSFEAGGRFYSFTEATEVLRSNGCCDRPTPTIFAPVDEVMKGFVGNVDKYSSIFLRHVVPCKILWKDLLNFDNGMVLGTYLEGYGIRISRSGDIVMLNEVPVSFPNMYQNDWLVFHGLRGILEGRNRPEEVRRSSFQMDNKNETSILDDDEF
ncbi:hypothetical protein P3X46_031439 [Hevea brasiliensis]|uniref:FAS1 domain-containing protein n=1 Tax=Hevea brasiliensis TaxID=3981 RepID=A0ABQ9KLA9_HEVBR|nr:hypothetical protein P3X46_031439 [Hevea brasiliensis]